MRISDVRMVWGWLTTTGSLLFKVAAVQSVVKLQQKKDVILQSITSTLEQKLAESEAFSVAIAITVWWVGIAGIWVLFNS